MFLRGDFKATIGCIPYEVIIPSQAFGGHFHDNTNYFIRHSQDNNENAFIWQHDVELVFYLWTMHFERCM